MLLVGPIQRHRLLRIWCVALFNGIFLCTAYTEQRKIPNAIPICGQAQMKSAIAVCTCIVILYLLDAAFFNGVYFAGASRMFSDMLLHYR
jgi:hypothetical protein